MGSVLLARKIADMGHDIDIDLVDKASLVHDIAKRRDRETKIGRDEEKLGAAPQLLRDAGYGEDVVEAALYTGRVPEMYLSPNAQDLAIALTPVEHLITAYVDARTRNTDIVGLEQALEGNVAKNPKDEDFYRDTWYPFYHRVEKKLFSFTPNFTPADLNNENALLMVQATN